MVIALIATIESAKAQDPHFSQFYANPLYLNPAFAGTAVCPRIVLNYRNQWAAIDGSYNSYTASYDFYKESLSGGLGLRMMLDREGYEGMLQTSTVSGIYSYSMNAGPNFTLKMGLEASFFQKKLDWSNLNFGDQIHSFKGYVYNTQESQGAESKIGADFSTGILGYSNDLFVGVAVHQLTKPDQGFLEPNLLPRKLTMHVGTVIDVTTSGSGVKRKITDPTISPNLVYQLQQNLEQLNYGLYMNKYPMILGFWYRNSFVNSDAATILIGMKYELFKIGYSYDITVSKLGVETGGAHEISFSWKLPCRPPKKQIKVINCPSF